MKVSVTKNEVKITELSQVNQGDYKVNLCTFVLPECFSGLSVTAVFNGVLVPVVENRCYIPSLESGNCILGVYAYKEENGETKLMYSPKPTVFYVDKGSFTTDVNTEALPKAFDYETYCNMLKDFWEQIVKENTPSSYNEKTNIYFNKFPFEVIDLPSTTESNYAYIIENGKCRPKEKPEDGFSPITKCPKYLGFRIEDDETRIYLYIGDMVDGKFVLDESYHIDTTDSGAVNHLRQSHNRFIETDGEKYFYYKVNEGSKDKVTLIGCDEFPEGESDIIATVPNYIKGGKKVSEDNYLPPETKLAGEKYYSVVLPSGCFYAVLNTKGMPTFLKDDEEDEDTTTKPIFNVSYQTGVTVVDGKEVPIIEVNRGASFGVIPENVGAALLRLPYTYELSDLCIYTSTPVKSNAKSGKRRKAKEIGEKLIKDFYFEPRKEIFWNDSVRPMRVGRTFYGVPYSSRWVNSHYLGFEVSAETVLYALNDPYSVAYEGGFVSADFVTDEETGKEVPVKKYRAATYSGYTEISGKEDEPEKYGGPGYGLVCSAFTNLICGNPYPQSNRGYTFDSNYVLEDTIDMNSGEVLVNKGLSHCVFVDEIYDKGYSLYEAVDPCVAKTTHTCPSDKTTYATSKVRTSTLDKYVYSVINKDISGYEKLESLLNFENIEIKSGKVRPWRGNKAVYGSWDITPKTNNRDFGGSGIGVTLHDDTTKFILKYPSYATKTIDKADPGCYQYFQKNGKYADISDFVTENGTYELYTVDETTGEKNSETEYFRFYNHDTVQLTFDEEGKAVFKYSDGKNKGKVADDVEYIYVNVKGYGGEFGKDTSLNQEESGAMVIAAGKCYPDLALDTSRILDVRAAIVSDPEGDYWGKYSCATSPDVVSEYKGGEFATKAYVDEAIKGIGSGNTNNQTKRHYGTFSVLGDSYSSFVDFVTPKTNACWYPVGHPNAEGNNSDVASVEQMWWHIFATKYKSALQVNNSFSGAPICYDGWQSGNTDSKEKSFITRANNIGTPELIFIFGGSNDDWVNADIGEYKYSDWVEDDFISFRPSLAYLLNYLKQHNAGAKIVFILNENLDAIIDESVLTICEHYGVDVIEIKNIITTGGHPTIVGQASIAQQVLEFMETCDIEVPDEAVTSISAVISQTEFTSGVTLDNLRNYLTVTATFESGTTAVVEDYELSGELVAGANIVTVSYREATTTVSITIAAESGTWQLSVDTLDGDKYQYYCPVFNTAINETLRIVYTRDFELQSGSATLGIRTFDSMPTQSITKGTPTGVSYDIRPENIDQTLELTTSAPYFAFPITTNGVNPLILKNFHCYVDGVEVEPVKWISMSGNEITAVKLA